MIECPVCHEPFDPTQGSAYLDETYCSEKCARKAAEEGRDSNEPVETEED
ncbi:MAG: hypothetical protein JRJ59_00805 [Deltaproteobacteria bacterium]|nr:hypothetical protein [Deltaproteobacteria bacterium]